MHSYDSVILTYPHVPTHFCYKPNFGRNVIVLAAENRDKWASIHIVWVYIYILVYVLVLTPLVQPPGCYSKECLLLLTVVYPTANLNLPMEPSISGKIGKVTTWTSCLPFASQKNSNCWFINIQPFKSMDVHPKWPMLYNREK